MSISNSIQPATARRLSFLRDLRPFLRPYRGRGVLAFALLCLSFATILHKVLFAAQVGNTLKTSECRASDS